MKGRKSKIAWQELVKTFPNEWVALVDYRQKGTEDIEGSLIAHDRDRKKFHKEVGRLIPQYKDVALRYTGELIKNVDIPLLWQISHTN